MWSVLSRVWSPGWEEKGMRLMTIRKYLGKYPALMVLVGMMAVPGVAAAQLANLKVGYVNLPRVLSESPQTNTAMTALQEEFAPRQRDLVAQQNALKEKQAKLQRDLEVMGPEERSSAQRELRKDERDFARAQDELREDANLRRNEVLGQLQREVIRQIQAYALKAGYDVVLSEGVVYVAESLDITQQILDAMQASAGKPAAGN